MAHEFHHVPGRLRVRLRRVKGDSYFGKAVEDSIRGVCGVSQVRSNALTGSVIVEYDPRSADTNALFGALKTFGYSLRDAPVRLHRAAPVSARPEATITRKVAKAVALTVIETVVERSVPLLISPLL